MSTPPKIRIGTRGSQLALWQARAAESRLQQAGLETELVIINTKGDKVQDRALSQLGTKGVFTEELETGLLEGSIEIAVHSAKDMPSKLGTGLELVAFMEREQVHDVVLSLNRNFSFDEPGIVVGTSSVRRRSMLRRKYPNLEMVEARGNLQTRIAKLHDGQFQAMLLAFAGVHRMEYEDYIVQHLSEDEFIPAVGQGSVAIETSIRLDSGLRETIRQALNHAPTETCLIAERAFLRTMEGGCSIPVFGLAKQAESGLTLTGGIVSLDGQTLVKETLTAPVADAEKLGEEMGRKVLSAGGAEILKEIKAGR